MIEVEISTSPVKEMDYSLIGDAMKDTGEMVADVFKSALSGAVLPGMTGPVTLKEKPQVEYQNMGLFEVMIKGPDISSIERGIEPFDMKPAIYSGPRHKVAKDGHWYVNVPFFHKESDMPEEIRTMAAQLETSSIIGHYVDELGVTRNSYQWGEGNGGPWQLPSMETSLTSISLSSTGYVRKHKRYSGMVKMQGSGYMTFRTASEKSPPESWWNPGKPANPVTESIEKLVQPLIEAKLTRAWEEAFAKWLS